MGKHWGANREIFYEILKDCWAKLERASEMKWISEGICHIWNMDILQCSDIGYKLKSYSGSVKTLSSSEKALIMKLEIQEGHWCA